MTSNDTPRTERDDEQPRDAAADGDTGRLPSPERRTVLQAVGGGVALGALGTLGAQVSTATGASFGDGVNLQPSYFCSGDQELGYDLMTDYPDIETVRIEIEPFSFDEVVTTVEDAKRWIDEAAAAGLDVIATYHHYPDNGSAEASALQNAADFWAEHYETLSQDTSFTVNMMNEWGNHQVSAEEYASAYNEAISTVREQTSYSGPIVCDAPGWGQGTYRLADAAEMIDDDDLILSAHVYPSAYNATTGQSLVPEDLDVLDESEYPCMIGEFGNYANSSGADWSAIVDYASDLGWPVIGWAWNGDGSDDPMNMADPYWGDDCSADSYTTSDYFSVVYEKLGSNQTRTTPTTDDSTDEPTPEPTDEPTDEPTPEPTDEPTPEPTDEPTSTPDSTPTDAMVVNDYDGDPAWSSHRNDLGRWCGAGSFENGDGEVQDGALVLEYDNGGWYQEQILRDVSDYSTVVLRLSGANGGEEDEVLFGMGGVRTVLSNVTDDSVGTSASDVRIDMEAAGIDRSSPSVRLNFWQGGSSTLEIEEVRLE
ncbi:cellulase family glycosylhydrolase [Halosimplex salinum]|uniref:cellulase family glycosylhydrolase n=1 Tax=Halosimplex salinum TaxID=1710538 RepID=UPI000F48A1ED|nr:cellulase family glycosylhydrolase [Halosimplex salinum]